MAYPVLAPRDSWFTQGNSTVKRTSITEIEIMDSYTPDSSVTVKYQWDASAAKDGSITCYAIGTKLIIAGNGSGKIAINEQSRDLFADYAGWMDDPFSKVTTLKGLDVFYAAHVTSIKYWFWGMSSIKEIDLTVMDLTNVIDINTTFGDCTSLQVVKLDGIFSNTELIDLGAPFANCRSIKEIDFTKCGPLNVRVFNSVCLRCASLESFRIIVNTCTDTAAGASLFRECSALKNVSLAGFNIAPSTNISFMFYNCSSLKEIDVSNWDVSTVTNFDHFAAHANLKRKGIENWKTTSATNMNALFHNCAEEELDLSGWDVSKVQFFCQMFENSPNLKRIKGLEKWNTSAGLGFDGMFERCSKLEEVDLSGFNTTKAKNGVKGSTNGHTTATLQNMFLSCNNLKKVTLGPNFSINGDGTNTAAANKLILPTPSTDYIPGADGNWYTFNGDSYAPNAVKDKTAETYYASFDAVADVDVFVKNGSLIDTAKAIREKNGTTTHYTPAEFGVAIRAL